MAVARPVLAPVGDSLAMAAPNQVTRYDPASPRIISIDMAQTEAPLPTKEEYLQDMVCIWRGKDNTAAASRDTNAGAAPNNRRQLTLTMCRAVVCHAWPQGMPTNSGILRGALENWSRGVARGGGEGLWGFSPTTDQGK